MIEPLLVFIFISMFIAMVLFMLGIFHVINYRQGRGKLMKRIKQQMGEEIRSEEKTNVFSIVKKGLLETIGSVGDLVKPKSEGELSYLRKTFLTAGFRRENGPVIFFGSKAFLAILFPVIFSSVRILAMETMTSLHFLLLSIILALFGFYLPNLWLHHRIATRKEKMLRGFPDALDLMVVCVEAGTGLDAAINRVGEEMKLSHKELSEEFKLLSLELRAGKPRRDALKNLALRVDLEDVNSLVTLLIQTDKFGTSIAQALRVYSDAMRTKRYQRAEEIAAKLPVKLIFPLVLFIFPSLFVAILGPGVIRIYKILLPVLGRH